MDIAISLFSIILGIVPVIFIPLTEDYYELSKLIFLCISAFVLLALLGVRMFRKKELRLSFPPVAVGLIAILFTMLISLTFASTNKIEALLHPIGPLMILSLFILVVFTPQISEKRRNLIQMILLVALGVLHLISIYQFIGIATYMFPSISFLTDKLWSPTGGPIPHLTYTIIMLPVLVATLIRSLKSKHESMIAFSAILSFITLIGTGLYLYTLIPKLPTLMMSPLSGWAVTMETLKTAKGALVGLGSENFVTAFTLGRTLSMNLSPLWNIRFPVSANFLFHAITVNGLLGGLATLVFLASIVWKRKVAAGTISLWLGVIVLLATPPTISTITLVVALALLTHQHETYKTLRIPVKVAWINMAVSVLFCLIALGSLYLVARVYGAEIAYYQSLRSIAKNDGTATYNKQIIAITRNPYVSRFHISYSQTCLALASSLAKEITDSLNNPDAPTGETLDKNRDLSTQLIQQSIREAKLAVTLNTSSVLAWENLARIYMNLSNIAQGADEWSITSYLKAIQLDPTNPLLRVEIAGVYVGQANYDQAVIELNNAIALKNDYANAYYNLGNVYKLKGDTVLAGKELEKTLKLVKPGTSDYEQAKNLLDSLAK